LTSTLRRWGSSSTSRDKASARRQDPDDASAQIDLLGAPWLVISEEPTAAQIGGSVSVLLDLPRHPV
jgi:hypothetical protein